MLLAVKAGRLQYDVSIILQKLSQLRIRGNKSVHSVSLKALQKEKIVRHESNAVTDLFVYK